LLGLGRINYHTLSDFVTEQGAARDALFVQLASKRHSHAAQRKLESRPTLPVCAAFFVRGISDR
jgi:hypothetical protein